MWALENNQFVIDYEKMQSIDHSFCISELLADF